MSDEPLEPFDPELNALLALERRAEAPSRALDRVWSRVGTTVPTLHASPRPLASHGGFAAHVVPVTVAAFVVGGLAGAGIYAAVQKPPVARIVYVDRVVPAPPVVTTANPDVVRAPSSTASTASAAPALHAPAPLASGESLARERALLDEARVTLTSGHAFEALALLDDHARRFHKPQLAEEREALAIQSLVSLERFDEARARATRFREASPNSLFLPVMDATLRTIP